MKTRFDNQCSANGAWHPTTRSVLECGSAPPLFPRQRPTSASPKSAGAPAQSKTWRTLAAVFTFAILSTFSVHAQNYAIDWFKISGGGGVSTNGSYAITGTIGQPDVARSTGGSYELEGGFWSIIAAIQTPGAPLLKVKRVGNTVEISWATTDANGFLLEETGSLTGTINWASVSTSATVVNNENVVTVPASTGFRFFRLRKP